jgi:hypothetical protein
VIRIRATHKLTQRPRHHLIQRLATQPSLELSSQIQVGVNIKQALVARIRATRIASHSFTVRRCKYTLNERVRNCHRAQSAENAAASFPDP